MENTGAQNIPSEEDLSGQTPSLQNAPFLALLLVFVSAAVLVTHWPGLSSQALSFDDNGYVTENLLIQHPGWSSAKRFVTEVINPSTIKGYYQPLTMISLMADYALGGRQDNLWQFHLTSLILHTLSTCLIAILLYLLFERPIIAAAAALLFGLHPMTVEPIYWIGERKTILAAVFAICSLVFYVRSTQKKSLLIYSACIISFILALLSKPTAIPLPLIMLLLDYWPLKRLSWKTVFEKVPFFVVAAVSALITYLSQSRSAAVALPAQYGAERIPLVICHNIIFYLYKIFWPVNLSSHYAIPKPPWMAHPMMLAGIIGTCVLIPSLIICLRWTRAPLTGWLIFFLAILPTMQIVQFSNVIASDKFAYLPSVGLLIVLAAFLRWLWDNAYKHNFAVQRTIIILVILTIACAEAFATRQYLICWRDSISLFKHMEVLSPDAGPVHNMLGVALAEKGQNQEAIDQFNMVLRTEPNDIDALLNLAKTYSQIGKPQQAFDYYRRVLQVQPANFKALDAFAMALANEGKIDEAIAVYRTAIKYNPDEGVLRSNMARILFQQGRFDEAFSEFQTAIQLHPSSEVHNNMGVLLAFKGRSDEAIKHYLEALRLDPKNAEAYYNYGNALLQKGDFKEAAANYKKAIVLRPNYTRAYMNLAITLAQQGNLDEAIEYFNKAVNIEPNSVQAHLNLAQALEQKGRTKDAARQYSRVIEIDPNNPYARQGLESLLKQQVK